MYFQKWHRSQLGLGLGVQCSQKANTKRGRIRDLSKICNSKLRESSWANHAWLAVATTAYVRRKLKSTCKAIKLKTVIDRFCLWKRDHTHLRAQWMCANSIPIFEILAVAEAVCFGCCSSSGSPTGIQAMSRHGGEANKRHEAKNCCARRQL